MKQKPLSDERCDVFCSLHHHTTYSAGDGHQAPIKHFRRAAELGMHAMALTEHGNPSSHAAGEQASKATGVKFIPGLEAYMAPNIRKDKYRRKCHQTILAMNDIGYQNLNRIVTQSYRDSYQFPTVTWDSLKEHNEGLIVTSGCASSLVSCKLLGGKFFGPERDKYTDKQFESAVRVVRQYKKVFGDRYYLEVQRFPELPRICTINTALERISEITGVPLLATADVHYCKPEQSDIQQALHAIHRGDSFANVGGDWEYDIPLTLPESDMEIFDDLVSSGLSKSAAESAIRNTRVVADRCNVVLPKSQPLVFPIPDDWCEKWADGDWLPGWHISDEMRSDYMDEQISKGIEYRAAFGKQCNTPEYQKRIQHELSIMKLRPEFIDYFLFLSDLITWAKDSGIVVGPGRGSAAASLVCYLLRITEIDPMTVPQMVFERFMDPSRTDLPDIDIDIADEDRWKLVKYLVDKYGKENVGNVANIIRYRGRSAIDKTGIILRIPQSALKPLKERVSDRTETDDRVDDSVADAIERYRDVPEVASLLNTWPEFEKLACAIEGDVQTFGTHAAGYVVASRPITETCALIEKEVGTGSKAKTVTTIPYDKRDAEYLGMMKADLLGLATCGMIDRALKTIQDLARQSGAKSVLTLHDIYAMEYDDPDILRAFREDDLTGIFQFEGGTTRQVCKRVQPQTIMDLSDINALARPGPLFSGAVDRYVQARHGEIDIEPIHELYDQHVDSTHGQLVYQEQIMKVLRDLAGFDTVKVLRVRKIIGKKLGEHQFALLWEDFRDGCQKTAGVDEETAWRVWSTITTAAGYAFCVTGDTVLEKGGSGGNDPDKTVTIAELYARQESKTPIGKKIRSGKLHLLGMDDDGRIRPQTLLKIHAPVLAPCLKFTVESGRTITVSTQHQFLTDSGYVVAEDISLSDSLIMDSGWKARDDERIESLTKRRHGAYQPLGESWSGAGNPGWIDGRTALWEAAKIAVASRSGNMCEECGKPDDGSKHCLEFSHIMGLEAALGNYDLYHSEHNVRHLCNSCHKKFDYRFQKTRVKRWAKGRPTTSERVVSIEDAGRQHVYDVSIAEDCHNYIGNGFVNHNNIAHSYSYSVIAYWSMYFKQNHPEAFFSSSLAKNGDGKDDIPRRTALLRDTKAFGRNIPITPLNYRHSRQNWTATILGGKAVLMPGFLQVPRVGQTTADDLVIEQAKIESELESGTLKGITGFDLLGKRTKNVGAVTIKNMKELASAEDPFGVMRTEKQLNAFREELAQGAYDGVIDLDPDDFWTSEDMASAEAWEVLAWVGLVANISYRDYVEFERTKTGKTTDEILKEMEEKGEDVSLTKHAVVFGYDEHDEVALRFGRKIYPQWQSLIEQLKENHHIVAVLGKKLPGMGNSLIPQQVWVLDPD